MNLAPLDITILVAVLVTILAVGVFSARRAGRSSDQFFLGGRDLPWWMLGLSMVATTFSADTPNLVTDIVRQNGVAGNWVWWAFLLTGLVTTFLYARLWRRTGFTTDNEFYEARYGGTPGRFLRGFRAVYLGFFFNTLVLATVCLAAIKMGQVVLGWPAWQTIGVAALVTMVFSALGGLRGVILTDMLLFVLAMVGAVAAAWFVVMHPFVGGLGNLFAHPAVNDSLSFVPDLTDPGQWVPLLVIPLAVQWWSAWYPGAEPGGGGYIAQRILSARTPGHAIGATLLFNVLHYAVRPWPWILVALGSLIAFPTLDELATAFPAVSADKLGHDLAYPAMLTMIPAGWLGLVLASLLAAFVSTLSTHLNWGASYLTLDVWKRFVRPAAGERELVRVGRGWTVLTMAAGVLMALYLENAKQVFDIILMFGAGTGLVFILRWFWTRINAWTEISAMVASGVLSMVLTFTDIYPEAWADWARYPLIVGLSTAVWLVVTILTPREDEELLRAFRKRSGVANTDWFGGLSAVFTGAGAIYGALFTVGFALYGMWTNAALLGVVSILCAILLGFVWTKVLAPSMADDAA